MSSYSGKLLIVQRHEETATGDSQVLQTDANRYRVQPLKEDVPIAGYDLMNKCNVMLMVFHAQSIYISGVECKQTVNIH